MTHRGRPWPLPPRRLTRAFQILEPPCPASARAQCILVAYSAVFPRSSCQVSTAHRRPRLEAGGGAAPSLRGGGGRSKEAHQKSFLPSLFRFLRLSGKDRWSPVFYQKHGSSSVIFVLVTLFEMHRNATLLDWPRSAAVFLSGLGLRKPNGVGASAA